MISWGITSGSHDGAIAVFENNNLIFATDAERFSRVKNDKEISDKLINFVTKKWGKPDKIYFYENPELKAERRFFSGQEKSIKIKKPLISKIKEPIYVEHHLSHAAYGYYTSYFDECLILVIDAIGEWDTLTLWYVNSELNFKKLKNWKYPKSLGLLYSACTQSAGWKPNEEEYIMMGASSVYEKDDNLVGYLENLWNENFNFHQGVDLSFIDKKSIPASVQFLYEKIFSEIIEEVIRHDLYNGNLIFCGGCALNVKANRFLSKIDNVYIPCNPGDGGSSVGCVLYHTKNKIDPTPYLGYDISGNYPIDQIIQNLLNDSIIGVAKGKAEFGPRALGNRSIFADPRVKNVKDLLNEIKGRESFRPFGAMILKEDVDEWYIDHGVNSPYMNSIFYAKDKTIEAFAPLVHDDKSTRLQIIDNEHNLRELLMKWRSITNCPMIINTSLNIKGMPLVNDEDDVKKFKNVNVL